MEFAESLGIELWDYKNPSNKNALGVTDYDSLGRRALITSICIGNYRAEVLQFVVSSTTALEHISLYDFGAVRNAFRRQGSLSSLRIFDLAAILNGSLEVKYREEGGEYRIYKYVHRGFRLTEYGDMIKDFRRLFGLSCSGFAFNVALSLEQYGCPVEKYVTIACDPAKCLTKWLKYPHRHRHLVKTGRALHISQSDLVIEEYASSKPVPVFVSRQSYSRDTAEPRPNQTDPNSYY